MLTKKVTNIKMVYNFFLIVQSLEYKFTKNMVYVIIKMKGSEKMNIDYNKKWESLTISNDFLFSKLMRDKEICKEVLEVLLNIKIGDLKYLEEQKIIDIMLDAKSVRLEYLCRI